MAVKSALLSTLTLFAGIFAGTHASAATRPCDLLTGEEIVLAVGGPMRGGPVFTTICYYLHEQREVALLLLDRHEFNLQRRWGERFGVGPLPMTGVAPQALGWNDIGAGVFTVMFRKGAQYARIDVKGVPDPIAAAGKMARIVVSRLP